MISTVRWVSRGFCADGSGADGSGADVSGAVGSSAEGSGAGSRLGSGGGDGEWFDAISVIVIWSVGVESSTCGGESYGSSENRLSITWLISSRLSSSTSLASSLANRGCQMSEGTKDEVRLMTT